MTTVDEVRAVVDAVPDVHEVPADPDQRAVWRIDDDGRAVYAMRQLAKVEAQRSELWSVAEAEIERLTAQIRAVQEWAAEEDRRRFEGDAAFWRGHLEGYALVCRDNPDDGRKSISTPYGVVKTRAGSNSWKVTDETAFLEWARTRRPSLIRNVEKPAPISDLRKTFGSHTDPDGSVFDTATGEKVPGVTETVSPVSVDIVISKGKKAAGRLLDGREWNEYPAEVSA